jgi:HSP20 family protein
VNRLLERFFNDDLLTPLGANWTAMPLAMWQDNDYVYIEADAPGIAEKDLDISVHEDVLCLRGERHCERQGNGYDSRRYGRFEQRINLPGALDVDKVEARLANGVLRLTFPKSERAKPRKIAVQTE